MATNERPYSLKLGEAVLVPLRMAREAIGKIYDHYPEKEEWLNCEVEVGATRTIEPPFRFPGLDARIGAARIVRVRPKIGIAETKWEAVCLILRTENGGPWFPHQGYLITTFYLRKKPVMVYRFLFGHHFEERGKDRWAWADTIAGPVVARQSELNKFLARWDSNSPRQTTTTKGGREG